MINVISIIIISLLQHYKIDLYCNLDSTLLAIPFFSVGFLLKNINIFGGKNSNAILSIFMFCLTYVVLCLNGPAQMNGPGVGCNILLFLWEELLAV